MGADYKSSIKPIFQAYALLDQAAPNINQWYPILPATNNVRIYMIGGAVMTVNETLEVRIIIDGVTIAPEALVATFATDYYFRVTLNASTPIAYVHGFPVTNEQLMPAFVIEGRNVAIDIRKTTAAGAGNLRGIVIFGVL